MPKVSVFIPCYNVQVSVREVLDSFSSEILDKIDEIVVIDNQSQDDTLEVLQQVKKNNTEVGKRLTIIQNSENYGLGGSQKIAYRYFEDQGTDYFMIIHGDNQTNGNDAAKIFLQEIEEDQNVDLVISSRFTTQSDISGYDPMRILGNRFFNFMTSLLTGVKISDAGAGVMLVKTAVLKRLPYRELTNGPQFNPQLNIMYYSDPEMKIKEVPITWSDSDDESSISAFKYCMTLLKILILYRVNKSFLQRSGSQLFNHQQFNHPLMFKFIDKK